MDALIHSIGAVPEFLVRKFVKQITSAVHCIHQNHILHFDIKSANVLIDQAATTCKLADFGGCHVLDTNGENGYLKGEAAKDAAQTGGSLQFMAPEVLCAKHRPNGTQSFGTKADIWCVWCLMHFELCCESLDFIDKILRAEY